MCNAGTTRHDTTTFQSEKTGNGSKSDSSRKRNSHAKNRETTTAATQRAFGSQILSQTPSNARRQSGAARRSLRPLLRLREAELMLQATGHTRPVTRCGCRWLSVHSTSQCQNVPAGRGALAAGFCTNAHGGWRVETCLAGWSTVLAACKEAVATCQS